MDAAMLLVKAQKMCQKKVRSSFGASLYGSCTAKEDGENIHLQRLPDTYSKAAKMQGGQVGFYGGG